MTLQEIIQKFDNIKSKANVFFFYLYEKSTNFQIELVVDAQSLEYQFYNDVLKRLSKYQNLKVIESDMSLIIHSDNNEILVSMVIY
jgi:hypothetical protein